MNGAANFLIAADHRIELALPGGGGEIAAVLLQGFVGAFWVLIGHGLTASNGCDRSFEFVRIAALLGQEKLAAASVARQGQKQVLDGDVAVAIAAFDLSGLVKDSIEALAQVDIVWGGAEAGLGGDQGLQLLAQASQIHTGLDQDSLRQPLLAQQG